MHFHDEPAALHILSNISYYRLKGYWWDMQQDFTLHTLQPNTYFEDIVARYNFDRKLRLILFDAIERIEIALRTKMIYHLSIGHGSLWYLNPALFENTPFKVNGNPVLVNGVPKTIHQNTIEELQREFNRSQEIFIKDHHNRYPNQDADAWKILEVATMGTLSKLYKNLKHQLPQKAAIAKELGLNLHSELSSWLEAISYVRNIIAHHSRIWSRNMVKRPTDQLNNPIGLWFTKPLLPVQKKRPFLIISSLVYLCNQVYPGHQIKQDILTLFSNNPTIAIYKLGFFNDWEKEPLWK